MIRELFRHERYRWLDLTNPTDVDLDKIEKDFGLHPTQVLDIMDPIHLPKFEKTGPVTFLILRVFDQHSTDVSDTVQSLTRKISIFIGPDWIISAHRMDENQFDAIFNKSLSDLSHSEGFLSNQHCLHQLFVSFAINAIRGYQLPLDATENELGQFEESLFSRETTLDMFQEIHVLRRRTSLIKRILLHTQDVIIRLSPPSELYAPVYQDLRETTSGLIFFTDELVEDITNLLSLQISLASQKTNEVVRVLTIFSVFFMPLTFIVGVYGMNFKFMPELDLPWGYYLVWVAMIVVTVAIAYWFRRKGWIGFNKN